MCQYNNIANASLNSQPAMPLSPHSADSLSDLPAVLACEGRPEGTCLLCADQWSGEQRWVCEDDQEWRISGGEAGNLWDTCQRQQWIWLLQELCSRPLQPWIGRAILFERRFREDAPSWSGIRGSAGRRRIQNGERRGSGSGGNRQGELLGVRRYYYSVPTDLWTVFEVWSGVRGRFSSCQREGSQGGEVKSNRARSG